MERRWQQALAAANALSGSAGTVEPGRVLVWDIGRDESSVLSALSDASENSPR